MCSSAPWTSTTTFVHSRNENKQDVGDKHTRRTNNLFTHPTTAMSVSTLAGRAVGQGEGRYAKKGQAAFESRFTSPQAKCENLSAIEIIALVQAHYGPSNQLDLTNKGISECLKSEASEPGSRVVRVASISTKIPRWTISEAVVVEEAAETKKRCRRSLDIDPRTLKRLKQQLEVMSY